MFSRDAEDLCSPTVHVCKTGLAALQGHPAQWGASCSGVVCGLVWCSVWFSVEFSGEKGVVMV